MTDRVSGDGSRVSGDEPLEPVRSAADISFDSHAPAEREYRSAERHRSGPAPTSRHPTPDPSPKARLAPVRCAECGHPVCHLDRRVVGALAGGLCTRCRKDSQGREKRVYTYAVVVTSDDPRQDATTLLD
jgi:hypothetical protein